MFSAVSLIYTRVSVERNELVGTHFCIASSWVWIMSDGSNAQILSRCISCCEVEGVWKEETHLRVVTGVHGEC